MLAPALLLDRDGVINVDHGYVHSSDQFQFLPGIFELCRQARSHGHRLVVVTNQAGIARGYYTEADFHALTTWMKARFADEGAPLDAVYFCPTHPTAGIGPYRTESVFRKPGPGMILQARDELNLDLTASTLLGDKLSDIHAGQAAGVGRLLLLQHLEDSAPEVPPAGCQAVRSLAEAVRRLGWLS